MNRNKTPPKSYLDAIKKTGAPLMDIDEDEYVERDIYGTPYVEKDYSQFLINKSLLNWKKMDFHKVELLNMFNSKHIDNKMHFDALRTLFDKEDK